MLSRMESGRAYDLFPFISAPVKFGFRKVLVMSMISRIGYFTCFGVYWVLVMSMISRAVIFEIVTFFIFAACSLLSGSRYPFSQPVYRRERCGV